MSEVDNPFLVLDAFFDHDHLYGNRDSLWELLKTTVTGGYSRNLNIKDRSGILYFYEHLEKLIEANYLIHRLWEDGRILFPTKSESMNVPKSVCDEESDEFEDNPIIYGINDSGHSIPEIDKAFLIKYHPRVDYAASILFLTSAENLKTHAQLDIEIKKYFSKEEAPVNIMIRPAGEAYNQLRKGHLFYNSVCRPERLKFDSGKSTLPVAGIIAIDEVKQSALATFEKIYFNVPGFLEGAKYYCRNNKNGLAAFSLHQAAEHSIRALLIAIIGCCPHTHSLTMLLRHSLFLSEEIASIFVEDNEVDIALLNILNKAYVKARYNSDFTVSPEDLTLLFERIERLESTVKKVFAEITDQFGKSSHSLYRSFSE